MLLNEKIQNQLREIFAELESPVKLLMFTQSNDGVNSIECQMCSDTRQLIEEIAALSEKISLDVYDFVADESKAQEYRVDKIPAVAILGGAEQKDYGIRFYGIPSGYEFGTLVEDILLVSRGVLNLSPESLAQISKLTKPVHIQVFTTPT